MNGVKIPARDDREVRAAEPGERAGREHGPAAGGDDADAGRVERLGLLARGAQVQADVRPPEYPGERADEGEARGTRAAAARRGSCPAPAAGAGAGSRPSASRRAAGRWSRTGPAGGRS